MTLFIRAFWLWRSLTFIWSGVCFFYNIDPKDPDKRECYWRHLTRTVAPDGLNFEDNSFLSFLVNFFLDKIFTLTKNFLCKYWDQIYWKMICYFSRKLFFCLFLTSFLVLLMLYDYHFVQPLLRVFIRHRLYIILFFCLCVFGCLLLRSGSRILEVSIVEITVHGFKRFPVAT